MRTSIKVFLFLLVACFIGTAELTRHFNNKYYTMSTKSMEDILAIDEPESTQQYFLDSKNFNAYEAHLEQAGSIKSVGHVNCGTGLFNWPYSLCVVATRRENGDFQEVYTFKNDKVFEFEKTGHLHSQ